MSFWHKRANPVDRSVREVERRIATLERQIRQTESRPPGTRPLGQISESSLRSVSGSVGSFVREMLAPTKRSVPVTYKVQQGDLFDAGGEAIRELEAEPLAFRRPPDLFQGLSNEPGKPVAAGPAAEKRRGSEPATIDQRLAQYLSVGSLKTYRPLKHVQRRERNRFFMWVGLSLVVAFLVYVILR